MYITNLDKKIANAKKPEIVPTICVWSDLLGFSNPFISCNWNMGIPEWVPVAKRLIDMQNICARNLDPFYEEALVSNDAIIRNLDMRKVHDLTTISIWFRNILYYFSQVNSNEKDNNLPGMRLVIAAGERLIHNYENLNLDDFVENTSKVNPDEISNVCKKYGNPGVMYNHEFMQMNTAFSKSYIIDCAGSHAGISGNAFYLDKSFIDYLMKFAAEIGLGKEYILDEHRGSIRKIAFFTPDTEMYYMGFELAHPIHVRQRNLKTDVYKLLKFYPWDENPKEFWFDLKNFEMKAALDPECTTEDYYE